MDCIKEFLESSTVHGLTYISTSRNNLVKLFWVVIVFTGFLTASFMIRLSFEAWEKSPIATTIETLPISKAPFPIVTVCPPLNTITNMNYDLVNAKNHTIPSQIRKDLEKLSSKLLQEEEFHVNIQNQISFKEENKYLNWYLGYSMVTLAYFNSYYDAYSY